MQQLHLVGVTTDHDGLIFSVRKGAKSGSFVMPLDDQLLAALADAIRHRNADGIDLEVPPELSAPTATLRRQSQLSPREIQARLRAGRSLEQIAAEAGVGEEWVARFAAPVEAERAQIVQRARDLVYAKPRRGDSGEPLGFSVRWNLAERGVRLTDDEFDAAWSGFQVTDETWMITFSFVSRKRDQEAGWEVDLDTGQLVARNRLASDLGYVESGRRRRTESTFQPAPPATARGGGRRRTDPTDEGDDEPAGDGAAVTPRKLASRKGATRKSSVKRAPARKGATAKKAAAHKASAKKAAANKSTGRKAATKGSARKAPAKKTSAKKTSAKKTSAKKAPAKQAPAKQAPARKTPGRKAPPARRPAGARGRVPVKKAAAKKAAAKKAPPEPVVVPPAPAKAVPNELGQRRLQMVAGTTPRPAAPRPGSSRGLAPSRPAATRPPAPPAPTRADRLRQAFAADAGGAVPPPMTAHREARPATPPPEPAGPAVVAVTPGLDVVPAGQPPDGAEARRSERRQARAAARLAAEAQAGVVDAARFDDDGGGDGASELPSGDGRVVRIRANRAAPPTTEAELVLPPDRPPLRPARPAAQPRRRRFNRADR